jgi:hypothetical protein
MKWKKDEFDRAVVVDEKGNDVCCCSIPAKSVKNMDDCEWAYNNAKLIAAAPDLLEACQGMVNLNEYLMGKTDILVNSNAHNQIFNAKQAIAKAESCS